MKYLIGSKKEFYDFINSITKEDKIGIITHIDLDGIASAVFLEKILEQRGLKSNFIEFFDYSADSLNMIYEKGKYNKLLFCDWNTDSFPKELNKLREKGDVLVFDHHPINKDLEDKKGIIKTEYSYCSAHALFDLYDGADRDKWGWLVCGAIIADYMWDKSDEAFDLIKKFYPKTKKDSSIWGSEAHEKGKIISGALVYHNPNFRKVYDLVLKKNLVSLAKSEKAVQEEVQKWINKFLNECEKYPEKNLSLLYGNPKYNIASTVSSIISDRELRGETIIFLSDIREGYVKASTRNQTGEIDLGEFLKKCTFGFENTSAGGHVRAASAIFPKKYLIKFKENLLK